MPRFEYCPLRFQFQASEPLRFPRMAANRLRGALGLQLAEEVFAPQSASASGFRNSPRPFVIRARELNGLAVLAGETFAFGLNVFARGGEMVESIAHAARSFLCGAAELRLITGEPVAIELDAESRRAHSVRVEFRSPTELKHEGGLAERPEFGILLNRIRDRVGALSLLYGAGPIDVDFRALGERAARIEMRCCSIRRQSAVRRSSRTGQVHPLGGFIGFAEYQGELTEFLPWLEAGAAAGVGRQAVWGKGEIASSILAP